MSVADDFLSEALRLHDEYRRGLRRLAHAREDADLDYLVGHFSATNLSELPVVAGLVASDIRIACNQEKRDRSAWAEVDQEVGS